MYEGKYIFSQLMEFLPLKSFQRIVLKYRGNHKIKSFTCLDQFYCMAFGQLTHRSGLRSIEVCLNSNQNKLYHMGFRGNISKSTLAKANENRDWRIYTEFAQILIHHARDLYKNEEFGLELSNTIYALDSTTIDLCLSLFPWAHFRKTKSAIKLHTLLDLRGNIPAFIKVTDGKIHDVNILDELIPEPGSFYIMDRGYVDFERLYKFVAYLAYYVTRAKTNLNFRRIYSHTIDKQLGLKCDQTIYLNSYYQRKNYPDKIRRIKYYDIETEKQFTFLTNNFVLPALTITKLYKYRWQIELFFKWIKQHLEINKFYGNSSNAVKTQIWIAITVYVLIAIIKKRLNLDISIYTFLDILSISLFEKVPILQLVTNASYKSDLGQSSNQLLLFD
jgi:transposase